MPPVKLRLVPVNLIKRSGSGFVQAEIRTRVF